ncbi:MAG: MerR family transcriptional regulator [Dehalococcoidales bacterium]|nr:MerR family transcriptional regulator [Dehalococcoidales bacterium]
MNSEDNEPRYVISITAKMLGIQTYTLRYYEKIGIVEPARSSGNIRLYSDRDIVMLRRAKNLMDNLGVNLAGAEVILRLTQRIDELQDQVKELKSKVRKLNGGG